MTWAVFYTDAGGEGQCETCEDWTSAKDILKGFIEHVNPPHSATSLKGMVTYALDDVPFHVTDGTYSFAIETI